MTSGFRNRLTVYPAATTWQGKGALWGAVPVPGNYDIIGDVVAGYIGGGLLRHKTTGAYVMWNGRSIESLPQNKVVAALIDRDETAAS